MVQGDRPSGQGVSGPSPRRKTPRGHDEQSADKVTPGPAPPERRAGGAGSGRAVYDWDRDAWVGDDEEGEPGETPSLSLGKRVRYTSADSRSAKETREPSGKRPDKGEAVAFTLLAGIAGGAGVGYGIDRLVGSFPALMVVGVFVGFAIALYAVYLETR